MARGRYNKGRGRGGGRGRGNGRGGGGGAHRPYVDNRKPLEEVDKRNEKFERYYNTLNIVPAGSERDQFLEDATAGIAKQFPLHWFEGSCLERAK